MCGGRVGDAVWLRYAGRLEEVFLRIGLELLTARPDGWRQLRDAAVSVEDAGFDSVWVPDHIERTFFSEHVLSMYEAVGMLGAIAESTTHVAIGASVHNAVWRHPVHIVHAASTLAEISDGRFVLGIGSGGRHYEYGFVDAPLDHPYSRFAEAVEIIRPLLDGEEVTYRGRFWKTFEARVAGVEKHRIPLMIAAQGPKAIDLAFRYGDEWNAVDLSGIPDTSRLNERIAAADQASVAHQRSPRRSVDLMVSPGPTPGMENIPAITGSTAEMVEALARFSEAGFDEVHCYGPAPSVLGTDAWRPIIEAVHAM